MLNHNTIKLFDALSTITKTIVINYPLTVGKSEDASICFLIDLSEFDKDQFNQKLYFYNNFDKFLSIFKLFDEYTVSLNNDTLSIISADKKIKSDFILSDKALMAKYDIDPNLFTKINTVPEIGSFELTKQHIKNIRNACGIFTDLIEIIFTASTNENNVSVSLGNYSSFNKRSNSYDLNIDAKIAKEFCVRIPVESIKCIPICDYSVSIKYSAAKNTYRILLKAKDFSNLQIILNTTC